ncbi:DNA-binding transcriptional MerR regulator [Pseudonocardia sediminis]|uniref:DNA-binding transcriptional MerR regulator n=1 Tax=Pseudonocardia sediminis TaxID=1397368 RepID=A0A4Q7UUJ0_PSEST|nr:MerR family transcriptional regulator [Pseudonocardia sediminis]RZT85617.1 DNA-binding transcriptional MerR regulator [Pseudonocardia sediminis]
MDGLKVSELAERAGVPATTLRFYEQHGLLTPRRSPSGYRLFDDDAVDQLRFIATAKSLGLSLDDIGILLRPWRREGCREVQRALSPMLEQRGAEARDQIVALQEFTARLDQARRMLDEIDRDGPCDAACPFLAQEQTGTRARPAPEARGPVPRPPATAEPVPPAGPGGDGPSVAAPATPGAACSLPGPSWHDRWARWSLVLVHATSRRLSGEWVRVEFDPAVLDDGGAGELAALVRAERRCCPALQMSLTIGAVVAVEARVPDQAALEVAVSLFDPTDSGPGVGTDLGPGAPTGSRGGDRG